MPATRRYSPLYGTHPSSQKHRELARPHAGPAAERFKLDPSRFHRMIEDYAADLDVEEIALENFGSSSDGPSRVLPEFVRRAMETDSVICPEAWTLDVIPLSDQFEELVCVTLSSARLIGVNLASDIVPPDRLVDGWDWDEPGEEHLTKALQMILDEANFMLGKASELDLPRA